MSTSDLYQPLPPGCIRVLELQGTCLAGRETDPVRDLAIQCALKIVPLDDVASGSASYAALSYVWGMSAGCRPLICNGLEVQITPNLHDALREFVFQHRQNQLIWVDAVCINQSDPAEKSAQVQLMSRIYSSAETVLVWLGTAASVAGGHVQQFWESLSSGDRTALDADYEVLKLGKEFLSNTAWFHRVWTLQEAVLAKSAEVHCGPYSVNWQQLEDMCGKDIPAIAEISYARTAYRGDVRGMYLKDLLQLALPRKASVALDRIYALLGLYRGTWPGSPDYTMPETQVFAIVTRLLATECGNTRFIGLVKLPILIPSEDYYPDVSGKLFTPMDYVFRFESSADREMLETSRMSWIPTWNPHSEQEADSMRAYFQGSDPTLLSTGVWMSCLIARGGSFGSNADFVRDLGTFDIQGTTLSLDACVVGFVRSIATHDGHGSEDARRPFGPSCDTLTSSDLYYELIPPCMNLLHDASPQLIYEKLISHDGGIRAQRPCIANTLHSPARAIGSDDLPQRFTEQSRSLSMGEERCFPGYAAMICELHGTAGMDRYCLEPIFDHGTGQLMFALRYLLTSRPEGSEQFWSAHRVYTRLDIIGEFPDAHYV